MHNYPGNSTYPRISVFIEYALNCLEISLKHTLLNILLVNKYFHGVTDVTHISCENKTFLMEDSFQNDEFNYQTLAG